MKKYAKIIGIDSEKIAVLYQDGTNEEFPKRFFSEELQKMDIFIEIEEHQAKKGITISITKGRPFELYCTCPQECDCQNPPPQNWDGVSGNWGISNYCPIHNEHPEPNPECPIHG